MAIAPRLTRRLSRHSSPRSPRGAMWRTAAHRARSEARSEAGGLAIFGLFIILAMLMVAGVAIDLMRYEQDRIRLQATTDRAVLAASSLRQTQPIETVVRDYLAREGMEHLITTIEADEGVNFRSARVVAQGSVPTFLMHLIGVRELDMTVISAAEERVPNLEISLVLDLSGSMNSFNRLPNLQAAAREFIETIFASAEDGNISMSLIPYTGQVNAGARLLDHFDIAHRQPYSHCVDFEPRHFNTTALPPNDRLQGAGHGFPWESPPYTSYYNASNPLSAGFYDCPIAPGNAGLEIAPFSTDPQALIAQVNAMRALGATSIDIGMRWGVALVDPSVRPVADALIAAGRIDPRLAGRPVAYDDGETLKIIVLMTDGENFEERRLVDAVKSGLSPVWINTQDNTLNTFSLFNASTNRYFHRRDGQWYTTPWGVGTEQQCAQVCTRFWTNGTCRTWENQCQTVTINNARQLTWPELFHRTQMYWAARQIFAPANGGTSTQQNNYAVNLTRSWQTTVTPATKDQRLQQICTAAREAGITVFSVAFEADPGGIAGLRSCATTPAHFFDVQGIQVSEAFRAIATHIRQLRLVE